MSKKVAILKVQQWGNSLAVRIPSAIAHSAHFMVGQRVEVTVEDSDLTVRPVGAPKLTLTQKLAIFDPARNVGEVMAADKIGAPIHC